MLPWEFDGIGEQPRSKNRTNIELLGTEVNETATSSVGLSLRALLIYLLNFLSSFRLKLEINIRIICHNSNCFFPSFYFFATFFAYIPFTKRFLADKSSFRNTKQLLLVFSVLIPFDCIKNTILFILTQIDCWTLKMQLHLIEFIGNHLTTHPIPITDEKTVPTGCQSLHECCFILKKDNDIWGKKIVWIQRKRTKPFTKLNWKSIFIDVLNIQLFLCVCFFFTRKQFGMYNVHAFGKTCSQPMFINRTFRMQKLFRLKCKRIVNLHANQINKFILL